MDVDIKDIQSASFQKAEIQSVLGRLSEIVQEASDIRDRKDVKNQDLQRALRLVESFLQNSDCICYGGMAINAHLPESVKFYDFDKTLPDYDFYTPTPSKHVQELVQLLQKGDFENVSVREGMHEGTTKVFVNYHGVADITYMPQWMFQNLSRRTILDNGIHYADAEFLRMNMYLELSRPMGEVERWDKVYKRLVLLNIYMPPDLSNCKIYQKGKKGKFHVDSSIHETMMEYVIQNDLIFLGAELERIYEKPGDQRISFLHSSTNPILVFSRNPMYHVLQLKKLIDKPLRIFEIRRQGELIPGCVGLTLGKQVYFLAIEEQFCHSFHTVHFQKKYGKRLLRIASLDTSIYIFYLMSFVQDLKGIVPTSTPCFAKRLVNISMKTRDRGNSGKYPLFSLTCEGHQPSKASLIRAKVERTRRKRVAKQKHQTRSKKVEDSKMLR